MKANHEFRDFKFWPPTYNLAIFRDGDKAIPLPDFMTQLAYSTQTKRPLPDQTLQRIIHVIREFFRGIFLKNRIKSSEAFNRARFRLIQVRVELISDEFDRLQRSFARECVRSLKGIYTQERVTKVLVKMLHSKQWQKRAQDFAEHFDKIKLQCDRNFLQLYKT